VSIITAEGEQRSEEAKQTKKGEDDEGVVREVQKESMKKRWRGSKGAGKQGKHKKKGIETVMWDNYTATIKKQRRDQSSNVSAQKKAGSTWRLRQ